MDFKLIHKVAKLYQSKARKGDNLTYKDYFGMAMTDLKDNYLETIIYLKQEPTEKPAFNLKSFLKSKFQNHPNNQSLNHHPQRQC